MKEDLAGSFFAAVLASLKVIVFGPGVGGKEKINRACGLYA
jgi:hypothetical protein